MRMWLYSVRDNKNRAHAVVAASMADAVRIANDLGWKNLEQVMKMSAVNVEGPEEEEQPRKEDGDASNV